MSLTTKILAIILLLLPGVGLSQIRPHQIQEGLPGQALETNVDGTLEHRYPAVQAWIDRTNVYQIGDMVTYEGNIYRALLQTSTRPGSSFTVPPGDPWELVGGVEEGIDLSKISSDGFGSSLKTPDLFDLNFEQQTIPVLLEGPGESFLGLCSTEKYIFAAPQDADALVRMNIVTGEYDTLRLPYPNVLNANRFRDKFNGIVYDGKDLYIAPSWSGPALRVDPERMEILDVYPVNTFGDDMYNGAVVANGENKIFFIPHDATVLRWIDKTTNTIGETDLSGVPGIRPGDKSFLSGCYDGKSLWLYPRASDVMLEINPKDGSLIGSYTHPAATETSTNAGYFHGGTFDGRKIWLTPFNSERLVWFDVRTKKYGSKLHNITTTGTGENDQYLLGSTFIDGYIFFSRFRGTKDLVVNTFDGSTYLVDSNLPNQAGGSMVYAGGKIYIVSALSPTLYIAEVAKNTATADETVSNEVYVYGGIETTLAGLPMLYDGAEDLIAGQDVLAPSTGAGYVFSGSQHINVSPRTLDLSNGGTVVLEYSGGVGVQNFPRIINSQTNFGGSDGMSFYFNQGANRFVLNGGSGTATSSTNSIPAGTGTHRVAVTFDASGAFFAIDGSSSGGAGGNFTFTPTNDVLIGNYIYSGNQRPFDRTMIKIAVYETRLTNAQLLTLTNLSTTNFLNPKLYIDFTEARDESSQIEGLHVLGGLLDFEDKPGLTGDLLVRNDKGGVSYTSDDGFDVDVNLSGRKVIGVAAPTGDDHAANRAYVDAATQYYRTGILDPRGNVGADVGTVYVNRSSTTPGEFVFVKESGGNGNTGWVVLGGSSGSSGDNMGNHTATQNLNLSGFKAVGLGAPTEATDAARLQEILGVEATIQDTDVSITSTEPKLNYTAIASANASDPVEVALPVASLSRVGQEINILSIVSPGSAFYVQLTSASVDIRDGDDDLSSLIIPSGQSWVLTCRSLSASSGDYGWVVTRPQTLGAPIVSRRTSEASGTISSNWYTANSLSNIPSGVYEVDAYLFHRSTQSMAKARFIGIDIAPSSKLIVGSDTKLSELDEHISSGIDGAMHFRGVVQITSNSGVFSIQFSTVTGTAVVAEINSTLTLKKIGDI